jgi:oxygen-independent coproporphyrinogen III oxidase
MRSTLPAHLYLHVPFCARRCSYCDFSIAVRRVVPTDRFIKSVQRELALRFSTPSGAATPAGGDSAALETVYLGGGTPSRLGGPGIRALLNVVRAHAPIEPGAEVTLEANPDDVTREAASAWRDSGVTRISLGVQSFDDEVLKWMHRTHDADRAVQAVETLKNEGFDDISIDLIFALPDTVNRSWSADLEKAIALGPQHVSLYGLTVEPQTPLGRWVARAEVAESPEDRYEQEYLEAHRRLTGAGFEHYEVSNYARPGRRARHNSAYWTGARYAGVGPAAHEFDGARRRWNAPYAEWERRLELGSDPMEGEELLTDENRDTELVYLGLRAAAGLRLPPSDPRMAQIARWVESGWATLDSPGVIRLTAEGWLRLDALAAALTASKNDP